jgi:hypothetical protein
VLEHTYVLGNDAEFACAQKPWQPDPDHGDADVSWVFARLEDAARVWD